MNLSEEQIVQKTSDGLNVVNVEGTLCVTYQDVYKKKMLEMLGLNYPYCFFKDFTNGIFTFYIMKDTEVILEGIPTFEAKNGDAYISLEYYENTLRPFLESLPKPE